MRTGRISGAAFDKTFGGTRTRGTRRLAITAAMLDACEADQELESSANRRRAGLSARVGLRAFVGVGQGSTRQACCEVLRFRNATESRRIPRRDSRVRGRPIRGGCLATHAVIGPRNLSAVSRSDPELVRTHVQPLGAIETVSAAWNGPDDATGTVAYSMFPCSDRRTIWRQWRIYGQSRRCVEYLAASESNRHVLGGHHRRGRLERRLAVRGSQWFEMSDSLSCRRAFRRACSGGCLGCRTANEARCPDSS